MSGTSLRSSDDPEKRHKKHESREKHGHRRSTRSRVSEDSHSKSVSKDDASALELRSPSLAPPSPAPEPIPPPVDPVAHLHPLLWTEADVALWLQSIGEGGLTSCFDVINGVLLVNLDEEQLTNLGVVNQATRKKLMIAIGEVKERSQKVNIKALKETRKQEQEVLRDKESAALLAMPVQYSLPKNIPSWSVADVGTFLDYVEIPEYKERFAAKTINGLALLRMDDASLSALGVDKLGHRKKILRWVHQMHEGTDPNLEPPFRKPTTTSQVSFRCFKGTDVRVFNVNGRSSLSALRQQLSSLYGKQIVKIRWKDAEGDMVTVVLDEDLQEACYLSEERNIVNLYLTAAP